MKEMEKDEPQESVGSGMAPSRQSPIRQSPIRKSRGYSQAHSGYSRDRSNDQASQKDRKPGGRVTIDAKEN